MGIEYFNPSSSSSSSVGTLTPRLKPIPFSYCTYGTSYTPVPRAGAFDKLWITNTAAQLQLYTTSSVGVPTVVGSVNYTTYLASAQAACFHMNTTDTCIYVLVNAGTTYQLLKMNDTTGVVTAIGSNFTPTTPTNWPKNAAGYYGTMEIDSGTGYLRIVANGNVHQLNKTTGAIVTQDVAISTLGSYLLNGVGYVTQDGSVGLKYLSLGLGSVNDRSLQACVHSSYGWLLQTPFPDSLVPPVIGGSDYTSSVLSLREMILVDNDKVMITPMIQAGDPPATARLYYRTDIDKLIKVSADILAGVS